jgi:signal transduction histidine kinase/ActR/RegA family two-component response regulator
MPDTPPISSANYHEAAQLSARNARIGIQTHAIAAIGVVVMAYLDHLPMPVAAAACALSLPTALLRWFGSRRAQALETIRPADWFRLIAMPALLANAIWGVMMGVLLWQIGLNNTTLLLLLGSIALVFGCTLSFAAFHHLSLALIGVHLAPPLAVALARGGAEWALIAVLLVAFLAYIVRQANSLYRDYWHALRTRDHLAESRWAAEQASRAKDQFLANISHEIRTPLNGIAAPAELLQRTALDPEQRHYAALIASSTRTLMQLIDDLLDFSKMQAGKLNLRPAAFAPAVLVDEIIARHRIPIAQKGIDLDCATRHLDDVWLEGDALRIGQVLDNLLSNAVKFTERGSIAVTSELAGTRWQVRIADTGCGIDPGLQGRIFQPFVQADPDPSRRHGGTGLGLSICRQLVEQMGGELRFTSAPGQGSCFELALALHHCGPAEAHAPATALRRFPGLRVLVAEDNLVNQQVIQRQLAQLEIDMELADNGKAALVAAQNRPFDLIFLDCQMPELDGYQTATRLRALGDVLADIPIIALTAHAMANDAQRALGAGMSDYLAKPVSLHTLSRTIGKWIDRRPSRA